MERLARTIVIAAASLASAWWFLNSREVGPRPGPLPVASVTYALEPRADDSPADFVAEHTARGNGAVAGSGSAIATGSEESRLTVPPRDTVDLVPLIAGIELPGGMWNLHAQLEREPRDVVWAGDMELKLSTYFASKPELARHFALPSVVCRTHLCEIQAVGYGPRPFDAWSSATADLRDQAWTRDFRAGGIYTTSHAPNEQAVVLILMRPSPVRRARSMSVGAAAE